MNRNPGGAGGGIDESVQQRPIGNGIATVEHCFGLAKGRRNRTGIQVIATDDDGGFDFAVPHQFIHGDAKLGALAITEPADAGRQSLEMNALFRQLHPARQDCIFREKLERERVGARDVIRIAAECNPAERPFSFAKERADVLRNKTGNMVGVLDPGFLRLGANVVAIIEGDSATFLQFQHRANMLSHRFHRALDVFLRILGAQRDGIG